jgi:hypothetical protein
MSDFNSFILTYNIFFMSKHFQVLFFCFFIYTSSCQDDSSGIIYSKVDSFLGDSIVNDGVFKDIILSEIKSFKMGCIIWGYSRIKNEFKNDWFQIGGFIGNNQNGLMLNFEKIIYKKSILTIGLKWATSKNFYYSSNDDFKSKTGTEFKDIIEPISDNNTVKNSNSIDSFYKINISYATYQVPIYWIIPLRLNDNYKIRFGVGTNINFQTNYEMNYKIDGVKYFESITDKVLFSNISFLLGFEKSIGQDHFCINTYWMHKYKNNTINLFEDDIGIELSYTMKLKNGKTTK